MKFLLVDYELLSNPDLNTSEKLILAFMYGLHKQGKSYWGGLNWLADTFGTTKANIDLGLQTLLQKNLIYRDSEGHLRMNSYKDCINYRKPTRQIPSTALAVTNELNEIFNNKKRILDYGSD